MWRSKIANIFFLMVLLVTPLLDQFVCNFCGSSPQSSHRLQAVSHVEDDCPLQDGFELEASATGSGTTHIHYCLLHSTFVALSNLPSTDVNEPYTTLQSFIRVSAHPRPSPLEHPPRA